MNFLGGLAAGIFLAPNEASYWICAGSGAASAVIGLLICNAISNNKEKAAESIASVSIIKQNFSIGNSRLSAGVNLINDKSRKDYALGLGLNFNF